MTAVTSRKVTRKPAGSKPRLVDVWRLQRDPLAEGETIEDRRAALAAAEQERRDWFRHRPGAVEPQTEIVDLVELSWSVRDGETPDRPGGRKVTRLVYVDEVDSYLEAHGLQEARQ